jgi:hypothetical protein
MELVAEREAQPLSKAATSWAAPGVLQEWFGLTDGEAAVLRVLFERCGEWVAPKDLALAARVNRNSLPTMISRVREAMHAEAIDSDFVGQGGARAFRGYMLTEIGAAECRAVLWAAGMELAAAS